jgi:hypothetical protein
VQVATTRLLIRPLSKALAWNALLSSMVLASAIVWWLGQVTTDVMLSLRLGALCLATGLAFVVDDPTEESTSMAPVSVLGRRVVRLSLALPAAAAAWFLLGHIAAASPTTAIQVPMWPFTVELIAYISAALAGSAVGARYLGDRIGGGSGAATVVLVASATALLPGRLRLWDQVPGTTAYAETARWWWAIAIAGGFFFVHYSRVGARRLVSWVRRSQGPAGSSA